MKNKVKTGCLSREEVRHQEILGRFDSLDRKLHRVLKKEVEIMADLTVITAKVQKTTDIEQSAVVLLGQLAELIRANATNPAELQALADQLDTNADALAAAVVANTPAAP